MKNKNLFIVTYYDNNNKKHITFINKFSSFKTLENQYGKKITVEHTTVTEFGTGASLNEFIMNPQIFG